MAVPKAGPSAVSPIPYPPLGHIQPANRVICFNSFPSSPSRSLPHPQIYVRLSVFYPSRPLSVAVGFRPRPSVALHLRSRPRPTLIDGDATDDAEGRDRRIDVTGTGT